MNYLAVRKGVKMKTQLFIKKLNKKKVVKKKEKKFAYEITREVWNFMNESDEKFRGQNGKD